MNTINISATCSIANKFLAELRDCNYQTNRALFRNNIVRIGEIMAYEISKTLQYSEKTIQTPLAKAKASTADNEIVLGTIFRAGLPFHQGFLDVFDNAGNAFVSAYRYYKDKECTIKIKGLIKSKKMKIVKYGTDMQEQPYMITINNYFKRW